MNLQRVDHLVYATPDLDSAIDSLERRLGLRASPGGRHPGRGTRNALIALGPASYLEIIGPDPEQPAPDAPRWFGIDSLPGPRLVAWAANTSDVERLVAEGARRGVHLGVVGSGGRQRPDGVALSWRFTDPAKVIAGGVVPFFIDWGASPHPASSAATGAALTGFKAEHPYPQSARDALLALGVDLDVGYGPQPALVATIRIAGGDVEIR